MAACNVELRGFSNFKISVLTLRQKVEKILQREDGGHGSITTVVPVSVMCAEDTMKDVPFLRVYSDDAEGGKRVAQTLCKELSLAVEFIALNGVFLPEE